MEHPDRDGHLRQPDQCAPPSDKLHRALGPMPAPPTSLPRLHPSLVQPLLPLASCGCFDGRGPGMERIRLISRLFMVSNIAKQDGTTPGSACATQFNGGGGTGRRCYRIRRSRRDTVTASLVLSDDDNGLESAELLLPNLAKQRVDTLLC